jgi:hypothetical protein
MRIISSLALEQNETDNDLVNKFTLKISAADVRFILEMYRSMYDERDPIQERDTNGERLFINDQGTVLARSELTELRQSDNEQWKKFFPKYRPRTLKETHAILAETWLRTLWGAARERKSDIERRSIIDSIPKNLPATTVE